MPNTTKRAPSRTSRKASKKRRSRVNRTIYGALSLAFVGVTIAILAFCAFRTQAYFRFLGVRTLLDSDRFYPGMTVDGVDLTGMTLADAMRLFRERETSIAEGQVLTFELDDRQYVYSAADLQYSSNFEAVVTGAWRLGRSGNVAKRYSEAARGCAYTINRGYTEDALRSLTASLANSLTTPVRNATVEEFIPNQGKFVFSDEQTGYVVDADVLYTDAVNALATGDIVRIDRERVEPTVRKAQLETAYGERSVAITNASSSNDNRLTNIKLACASINGTCLQPGESFSFNEVVGQRTASAGYKKAGVYISGELGEEIGGGICQVATTLFNAVVKADLTITERHAHSRTVAYVDEGKDATVSWGSQDLKFTNTLDEPVYIVAYVNSSARVKIHVFGKLRTDGLTVSVVPVLQQTLQPKEATYRYTTELPTGQQRVASDARKGYKVNTYKAYTDADGNVVDKVFLFSSTYPAAGAVIEVGY